jgi:transglutaminase-like putative cysteine protease
MSRAARMSGSRLWLGTAVVLVAVLLGLRSLSTLLAPGAWWETGIMLVVTVAALVATLRQVLRSRLAPTAWGVLAGVIGLTSLYGDAVSGPSVPRPTAETVERLRLLVDAGVQTIAEGRIPVQPTRGLELIVVTGAVATYLVAELLGLGMGRGGLAGVAVAGLWAPAVSFERDGGFLLLLGAGTTYLLLLALTRPRSRRNDRSGADEAPRATVAAAGLTIIALGLGAAATGLPFHGSVGLPSGWGGQGLDAPLRISTDLDMRADLQGRSDRTLLQYTGDIGAVNALRMYTLTDFDGREWQPPVRPRGLQTIGDGVLWPDEVSASEAAETPATVEVEVLSLSQDRLPVPPEPREVDVPGIWLYDAERDEVVASDRSTRGLTYSITVHSRELTAEALQADNAGSPEDGADYLTVPATEHEADIRALAQQVVTEADATTTYDQAIAVQSYLRNAQNFTYSTELGEPQTDDAVWDFLTDRRGYCVQYATAMTIMARSLDIPARMAVGFLPGRADGEVLGRYLVSGRQAHTWPELYFEDAGWVRFEPTPARQTGAPPVYADPFAGLPISPEGVPTSTAVPSGVPSGGPGALADGRPGYVSIGRTDLPILVVVGVVGVVVLALAVLVVLVVRRRRRGAGNPQGPEEWWAALRERLAGHGVVWTDATTPRQAAMVVRERLPRPDLADPAELAHARGALTDLVAAVETERYTTRTPSWSAEELSAWVAAVERPLTSTITTNGEPGP